jgi:hypothetical protein
VGNQLFGIDVAGIVADALGDGLFPVTITRYVQGEREAGNLTGGRAKVPETVTGPVGFWEDFTGTPPADVEVNDRKLILLGDTVPAGGLPRFNDEVTVHEDIGDVSLFAVRLLARDPAAATYTYLCRDRRGPDGQ